MDRIGIALALIAAYSLFVLVKPAVNCGKCSGWGQHGKPRRRPRACPKCKGTGKQFLPGARLVHKGAAKTYEYLRKRMEGGQ